MAVVSLLRELKSREVTLTVAEGKLRSAAAPGAITPVLAEQIRAHKAELVDLLERQQRDAGLPPLTRRGERDRYPASSAQQRLWFIDQLEGDTGQYHITSLLRLRGELDEAALGKALDGVCARHESLRSTFEQGDTQGQLEQVVQAPRPVPFTVHDLTDAPGDAQAREIEAMALVREHARQPFHLGQDLMVRALMVRLASDECLLLITMHHIASDGWSRNVFVRELVALYEAAREGVGSPLAPLAVQYGDFAAWQQELQGEGVQERQLAYWCERLRALPQLHSVPLDKPRPARQSFAGRRHRQRVPRALSEAINQLARDHDCTPFMVLQAAFAVLIGRWSNEQDVVMGTPVAGRQRQAVEPLIGFFVNTLVLRTQLQEESFASLLARTRRDVLNAFSHQEVPFESLVEAINPARSLSHAPLFQIMFSLQNNEKAKVALPGLALERVEGDEVSTKVDLELNVGEDGDGFRLTWLYPQALFVDDTIARMSEGYLRLLQAIVAAPQSDVDRLPVLSATDQTRLQAWNESAAAMAATLPVYERFMARVAEAPEGPAASCQDHTTTYAQLAERAHRIAHLLAEYGVGQGDLVGLSLPRGTDMIAAMLGAHALGAAFVALDPAYPQVRLQMIAEDSGLRLVVGARSTAPRMPSGCDTIVLDEIDLSVFSSEAPPRSPGVPDADEIAYVIYTSGSTGRPKGVEIRHSALSTLIDWAERAYTSDELARVLVSTSLNFDLSMFEIFVPLCLGHTCVVARDALALAEEALEVTLINTVPSAIKALLDLQAVPASVRAVNLAGEPLPAGIVNRLLAQTSCVTVRNLYGPSEDTTYSTCAVFTQALDRPPSIGRPIDHTQAYVLSPAGEQVPVGAIGELYLAGAGLARGYRGQAQLTAERFQSLACAGGARAYRTGDLVRYLADGTLEFIGRADDQLKVRGFRVEPGEIEFWLNRHPQVRESVVLACGEQEDRRLVAYLVPKVAEQAQGDAEQALLKDVRSFLAQELPDYMMPAAIVALETFPLTPNGKVDKCALPLPTLGDGDAYVAPQGEREQRIAELWGELLGLERVSATANFFTLGGHSLLATRVVSAVNSAFDCDLPVRALFEHSTVRDLAGALAGVAGSGAQRLPHADRTQPLPLSFAQQRLWFFDQYDEGQSSQYNMPMGLRLRGAALDERALAQAVTALVARHEVLRTVVVSEDGEPVQRVLASPAVPIDIIDLSALHGAAQDEALEAARQREAAKPFALGEDLMLRVTLVRLGAEDCALLMTFHHIAADGWSLGIAARELGALYAAARAGEPLDEALEPLSHQYADYATWQRERAGGEQYQASVAHWREHLADSPPVHGLPLDFPRPAQQGVDAQVTTRTLDARTTAALRALAEARGLTLFMLLQACFALTVGRWSNQRDVVLGTPVAGRAHGELEPLIGCFINTLALRTQWRGDESFADVCERVRSQTVAAYDHQAVPFEHLVDELAPVRDPSHAPLFQLMFSMATQERGELALPGIEVQSLGAAAVAAKFDLDLSVVERGDELRLSWMYATGLFKESTIARLAQSFERLLAAVLEDPTRPVSAYAVLPNADVARLRQWNATSAEYSPRSLAERVADYAISAPEQVAVADADRTLTYRELQQASERLAAALMARGVRPKDLVALQLGRSVDVVVAVFAVWQAGATCLPLDPTLPAARRRFMLEDAQAPWILCDGTAEALEHPTGTVFPLKALLEAPQAAATDVLIPQPHQAAYVTYTSGSSGQPKGVVVEHDALSLRRAAWERIYALRARMPHLGMASIGFDVFMGDVARSLGTGGTLVLCPRDTLLEPAQLIDLMDRWQVRCAEFVPAVLRAVVGEALEQGRVLDSVQCMIVGSDMWTRADHQRTRQVLPAGALMVNSYGLTEAGIDSTCFVDSGAFPLSDPSAPIGRALDNVELFIVDADFAPLPIGAVGELVIGGKGLARGYLNRQALTDERFVRRNFEGLGGGRVYRTGDLARWREDGLLELAGRADDQIKIRGFRVEPGEVQGQLERLAGVREALVLAQGEASPSLVAYVVADERCGPSPEAAWRDALARELPGHMVPAAIAVLPAWPLSANGKIDRKALPALDLAANAGDDYRAPRSARERTLCEIWQSVLRVEQVGVDDNFFAIGGDSILSIQVVSKANAAGFSLSARHLFEHQTVAELATVADGEGSRVEASDAPVEGALTLLPVQQRFFEFDLVDHHHDNQSVLLTLEAPLDREVLAAMLGALYQRHDALRLRFQQDNAGTWGAQFSPLTDTMVQDSLVVERHDAATDPAWSDWVTARCNHWQGCLDITEGPVLRAVQLEGAQQARLLLVVHHLVVDGVSWRILLSDIEQTYAQAAQGDEVVLAPKSSSLAQWSEALTAYANSEASATQRAYWQEQLAVPVARLPQDRTPSMPSRVAATRKRSLRLDARATQALLQRCGRAYRTQINELLLAGVYLGLRAWTGQDAQRLDLEGHGREPLFDHLDTSSTVGWFTTVFPLTLRCESDDPATVIKSVKEAHRAIPDHGVGYGALRYLSDDDTLRTASTDAAAQWVFNYLGQLDQALDGDGEFGAASEGKGEEISAQREREHLLGMNAWVGGGCLTLRLDYAQDCYDETTIDLLIEALEQGLTTIIAHCDQAQAGAYTPADFPLATVSMARLDQWQGDYPTISKLYPATPMQAGMLFHSLLDASMYVTQTYPVLVGELDGEAFRQAWQQASDHHDVLRTVFVGQDEVLHQLVVGEAEVPWVEEDWRELSEAEQRERFEAYRREDKARGFDVGQPPLQRFALFRLADQRYQFLWSHHHMLMDGWSTPHVYRDVMAAYAALAKGEAPTLSPPADYQGYMRWLAQQDEAGARAHWHELLGAVESPTPLGLDGWSDLDAPDTPSRGHAQCRLAFSEADTQKLQRFARGARVTVNTVLQWAWGYLLHRYSDTDEVIFGATISGRPPEVDGVDEMLGLFINTIPVRVRVDRDAPLGDQLQALQREVQQGIQHGYLSLADIQRQSGVSAGRDLFDSLIVFENFPLDAAMQARDHMSDIAVERTGNAEQTNYRLTLSADLTDRLRLTCGYWQQHFTAATAERVLAHLRNVLLQLADGVGAGDLAPLTAAEQEWLRAWNDTTQEVVTRSIPSYLDDHVREQPMTVAVSDGERALNYAQLDARSNALARALIAHGAGPGQTVALSPVRNVDMLVAVLAVWKSGAQCAPFDSKLPLERRRYILSHGTARILLGHRATVSDLADGDWHTMWLDDFDVDAWSTAPLDSMPTPEQAAYLIYTSGSTGTPKGVVVEHEVLSVKLDAWCYDYDLSRTRRHLQVASVGFDVFMGDVARVIGTGGTMVICPAQAMTSPAELLELIESQRIEFVHMVPAMLRPLVAQITVQGKRLEHMRYLVVGADVWGRADHENAKAVLGPQGALVSSYGITEAGIDSTCLVDRSGPDTTGRPVPIGAAQRNVTLHVLGRDGQELPIGAVGELYIGGRGLARGYHERPQATAERFLTDPAQADGRRYRSGDLVRWRHDGLLEFIGRADHQVKIRGFRIEPAEIEAALVALDEVEEALVVARGEGDQQRLVAYVIAAPAVDDAGEQAAQWRSALSDTLPDYMLPAAFVALAQWPLSANGKIDRKRLPAPAEDSLAKSTYRAPRDGREQTLCDVWGAVLGLEQVGIDDNFFAVGGDSILAIQIVARANAAGVGVTAKALFEHPTIAELARRCGEAQVAATPQEALTGAVSLTPIQRRFLEAASVDAHHFNQSVLLTVPSSTTLAQVREAMAALVARHDALRLRFPDAQHAVFAPLDDDALAQLCVEDSWRDDEHWRERATAWQGSLDLTQGPLLRAVLARGGEECRLLLVAHHLVVDGVSWRVLLADLQQAMAQIAAGESVSLAPKSASVAQWAELMARYTRSDGLIAQRDYWLDQLGDDVPALVEPGDAPSPAYGTTASCRWRLDGERTTQLLGPCAKAYRTQINELLLSALTVAVRRWRGAGAVRVLLEGHGREALLGEQLDLSATVGWFTSMFPLVLDAPSDDLDQVLKAVKETYRTLPDKGLGYGALRYLAKDPALTAAGAATRQAILFNYLGQFDQTLGGDGELAGSGATRGPEVSARATRDHTLGINAMVAGGELEFTLDYSCEEFTAAQAQALLSALGEALEQVVAHCMAPPSHTLTPSDFPLAQADQRALDAWQTRYGDIARLYPATPMQQGMLYHDLVDQELYVRQTDLVLDGALDVEVFEHAWQQVVARHDIFRTAFVGQAQGKPQQLVCDRVALPLVMHDWSALDPQTQDTRFDDLVREDKAAGFDVEQAPLMRVTLVRLGDGQHRLLWTYHHLLLDGWSVPRVYADLMRAYRALANEEAPQWGPAPVYEEYIAWLTSRDEAQSLAHWREAIGDLEAPTPLGVDRLARAPQARGHHELRLELGAKATGALKALASAHQSTINTVLQLAWAHLLHRYSGESSVVFGATVSGRPAEVAGVEDMVGLFINAIPVRVDFHADETVATQLTRLQAHMRDGVEHGYLGLPALRRLTGIQEGPLFESLWVFENYPLDASLANASPREQQLRVRGKETTEPTNYKLTVIADAGETLRVRVGYRREVFADATVERLVAHLRRILLALPQRDSLASLDLRPARERRAVADWNDTAADYPRHRCLHQLVQDQVARTPDAVAVVDDQHSLTYAQLEARANRLAQALAARGVGRAQRVGVSVTRNADMVVALLGVLKAGAAYVPLDPEYPAHRLAFLREDSAVAWVLVSGQAGSGELSLDELLAADVPAQVLPAGEPAVHPDDPAYVLYTSGSTGQPKGVVIRHRNAVAMVSWASAAFSAEQLQRVLASTSLNFDLSVFELFVPLANGHRCHVVGDALALVEKPADVTLINTVPSAAQALLARGAIPPSVHTVNLAGEPLQAQLVNRLLAQSSCEAVYNLYGPSEDTTYSTFVRFDQALEDSPTIGRPISNTQAHVLDSEGRAQPIGVAGELYLTGDGVALGYHRREALTGERFVGVTLPSGEICRAYRTGDLVRRLPDGQLDFLGRADDQVKIRGFRIELGEVRSRLSLLKPVRDALVMARDDGQGTRLVAYVVPATAGDSPQSLVDELRATLAEQLPKHMVPTAFIVLDAFPLNPNGKVDRRALPAPSAQPLSTQCSRAPRSAGERALCEIWCQALGLEQVGVDDNFFAVGGDSILAIQVVALAREAGFDLRARDVLELQTVAELAAKLPADGPSVPVAISDEPVTGELTLLPIQRWLLGQSPEDLHHYNQSLLLKAPEGVSTDGLRQVAGALLARHAALRLRFEAGASGWRAWHQPWTEAFAEKAVVAESVLGDDWSAQLRDRATHWQGAFDLATGPLLRIVHFRTPDGPRLLLLAHHLVVDGVSWRVLLADLQRAYGQWEAGEVIDLGAPAASLKSWGEALQRWAQGEQASVQLTYWQDQLAGDAPALPFDHVAQAPSFASTRVVRAELASARTAKLLSACSEAYGTRIQELLMAALSHALGAWAGEGRWRIDLEGHGREALDAHLPIEQSVGWFTSLYPVALDVAAGAEWGSHIIGVKEALRAVPDNGVGYGALRYLSPHGESLAYAESQTLVFNYLGQLDQAMDESAGFASSAGARGPEVSPRRPREHALGLNAMVSNGCLSIKVDYSAEQFEEATMARLARALEASLEALVDHCLAQERRTWSPADFPLCRIDFATLQGWQASHPQIEKLYPATPMQQGMHFHSQLDPAMYVTQVQSILRGQLDLSRLREAWEAVLARHDVLRTAFVGEGEQLHQLVVPEAALAWHEEDWSEYDASEQEARFAAYQRQDKAAGFDLARPPLMRVAMFRLDADRYQILWTHHHMLLDGWSLPIVYRDVMTAYGAGEAEASRPSAPDYERYMSWLATQSVSAAHAFWRDHLAGFSAPTPLVVDREGTDEPERFAVQTLRLDAQQTAAISELARRSHTTANTVLQLAWGHLLQRYSGEQDVVFGTTISGRPPEVDGVADMVGLFINTIPVRMDVASQAPIDQALQSLRERMTRSVDHGFLSLTEIQAQSAIAASTPLFESLLIFENYPIDSAMDGASSPNAVQVEAASSFEQTHYKLTLSVDLGERLTVHAGYWANVFGEATVARLLGHLKEILTSLATAECLGDVDMLSEAEHASLAAWNDTRVDYDEQETLAGLVRRSAEATPDALALVQGEQRLSYAELYRRALACAALLRGKGVTPGDIVALYFSRSPEMVVGLLGTMLAGAACLPILPGTPRARLGFLLGDAQAAAVLTHEEAVGEVLALAQDERPQVVRIEDAVHVAAGPAHVGSGEELAYVIYTSGSTGTPKGVRLPHRGMVNHIVGKNATLGLTGDEVWLQCVKYTFDPSVFQLFCPLAAGATVVLLTEQQAQDMGCWDQLIEDHGVTGAGVAPSQLAVLLELAEPNRLRSLRHLFTGGETLPRKLKQQVLGRLPWVDFYNLYGPTECSIEATYCHLNAVADGSAPIGRAHHNVHTYVLDGQGRAAPIGVYGELYIGGDGVAAGYLNRPELDRAAFIANPYAQAAERDPRVYRTGDIVCWREDGLLEFAGRRDGQVKIRGHRIELGEIEHRLSQLPGVEQAAVLAKEDAAAGRLLVAYVSFKDGPPEGQAWLQPIRAHLASQMPEYMVPQGFVAVDQLPWTDTGKVDRKALLAMPHLRVDEHVAARSATEQRLVAIWCELLGIADVGVTSDFFTLGGHSLLVARMNNCIEEAFGVSLPLQEIFQHRAIRPLSERIDALLAERDLRDSVAPDQSINPATVIEI